jgi:hypothetical protein
MSFMRKRFEGVSLGGIEVGNTVLEIYYSSPS